MSVRLPVRFVSSASQKKVHLSDTRPASTRKAVPTVVTYATKHSKVENFRMSHDFYLPRSVTTPPVVFVVTSQGATSCSSASTQRHEEVSVSRLWIQIHQAGKDPLSFLKTCVIAEQCLFFFIPRLTCGDTFRFTSALRTTIRDKGN